MGFRWFVQLRASELGLLGFVRNLPGEQVEVVATGPAVNLQQLEQHLQRGPTHASVTAVENSEISVENNSLTSFEII